MRRNSIVDKFDDRSHILAAVVPRNGSRPVQTASRTDRSTTHVSIVPSSEVPFAVTDEPPNSSRRPPDGDGPARSRARAYYELTKPGIAVFAMMTAGAAYYVASRGSIDLIEIFHTLLGTVLATAGALALNQYLERDLDALMVRTRSRPLPSGRLRPVDALLFGLLLVVGGVAHLWATVGPVPAMLTLASAAAYNLVYTPMKSRTYAATFAGAVPGAMPALIGWSAATGTVGPGAFTLFGIAYVWQIPHVLALSWLLRDDYARAGFLFTPPSDTDGTVIGKLMVFSALLLLVVSVLPTVLGLTGVPYFIGASLLGAGMVTSCVVARRRMAQAAVRRVFLGSLAYLPVLFGLMLLDAVRS